MATVRQLLIDAGPLIALFHAKDDNHDRCVAGFRYLFSQQIELLMPCPLVYYDVFMWLKLNASDRQMRNALRAMAQSLQFLSVDEEFYASISQMQDQWTGLPRDTTLVAMAMKYGYPIWTLNQSKFEVFQMIRFWHPQEQLSSD